MKIIIHYIISAVLFLTQLHSQELTKDSNKVYDTVPTVMDSSVRADSLTIDSLPAVQMKTPYVNTSLELSEVLEFKNEFMLAAEYMQDGEDSAALEILLNLNSSELLAGHYTSYLAAELYRKLKLYKEADSILVYRAGIAEKSRWKNYFKLRRLHIYPHLEFTKEQELDFLRSQLDEDNNKHIKTDLILQIIKLEGFDGTLGKHDKLIKRLFDLGGRRSKLDSLYTLIIKKNNKIEDEFDLMIARYEKNRGKSKDALKRCSGLIKRSKSKSIQRRARKLRAYLEFKEKNYKNAKKYFENYLKLYGNDKEIMVSLARAYARTGDGVSSRMWYGEFLKAFPGHKKTADIYWMWAWDEEDDKHYDSAVVLYQKLLPRFIKNRRGRWVNFRVGYIHYKRKNYSEAIKYFRKSQKQTGDKMAVPAGMYWEAKTLRKLKKKKTAYKKYLETYKIYPTSFYGFLAKQALVEDGKWDLKAAGATGFRMYSDDSLKIWLNDLSKSSREPDSSFISKYITLEDLFKSGLDSLAYTTFRIYYHKEKDNPVFLYKFSDQLSSFWEEKSYFLARKLSWKIMSDKWAQVPARVLKLIFPRPFKGFVKYYSIKFQQEDNFMYALMKQESGFAPEISSPAGALGLMQVMPATGRTLAKMEKIKKHRTSDLTIAEINVRLGTRYLHNLGKKYNNDQAKILCNYNAGPRPTKRWSDKHGNKPLDVFTEEIGYRETRDYVKKVMGNYWTYKELYSRD